MRIGIMGAMPEEVKHINELLPNYRKDTIGERKYYIDQFAGHDLISVYSRCGKVSAAATTMTLIDHYKVDFILFTGVAGAVDQNLEIGDIVVGDSLYQHDMDGRPLFPRFEIPLSGRAVFPCSQEIVSLGMDAAQKTIAQLDHHIPHDIQKQFGLQKIRLHQGTIASGDQFIADPLHHQGLAIDGHRVLAVEMEGAALAQVCTEHQVPFLVLRTISDKADHSASVDFQKFIDHIASIYSRELVRHFVESMPL